MDVCMALIEFPNLRMDVDKALIGFQTLLMDVYMAQTGIQILLMDVYMALKGLHVHGLDRPLNFADGCVLLRTRFLNLKYGAVLVYDPGAGR